ncbi:MAG TPA: DUF5313 family protein [Pseudonocardiaceae bacterium]|jgi:hypothetical protein
MLRYLTRILAQALPVLVGIFVLLRLFTPVPAWTILAVMVLGLLVSLFYTIGTARDLARVRLGKQGFPPDVVPSPSRLLPEDASTQRRD